MNRLASPTLVVAMMLGIIALFGFSDIETQQSPVLGFVDIEKVHKDYKKTAVITKRLIAERAAQVQVLKQKLAALKVRRETLASLDSDAVGFARELRNFELEKTKIEADYKARSAAIEAQILDHRRRVYKSILQEAEIQARKRGMTAVFQFTEHARMTSLMGSFQVAVAVRNPIWFEKRADLTALIIYELNK